MKLKIKTSQIKNIFKKFPRVLAEHAFLSVLSIILVELVFGGLLWYHYHTMVQKTEPEETLIAVQFDQNAYQEVRAVWQDQQKRFEAVNKKAYSNPFFQFKSESATSTP